MIGDTVICRWKGGKRATYSVCADDSLSSQLDFMAPEMLKRGFAGTFWINPGRGEKPGEANCWLSRKAEWLELARAGFDFGNHTLHHEGAKTYAEAEYEISESAKVIHESNPGQHLQLFLRGGGTTWLISDEEVSEIAQKYDCVEGRGGGVEDNAWHDSAQVSATEDELIGSVDMALKTGSWRYSALHGVGPKAEWLCLDAEPFVALMDYLYEKRAELWVDTNTNIHKYMTEYAKARVTAEVRGEGIAVGLSHGCRPDWYDYPLTLTTEVPGSWERCLIVQGGRRTSRPVRAGHVMYDAMPGSEEVRLARF